jgi:hypothetical protein
MTVTTPPPQPAPGLPDTKQSGLRRIAVFGSTSAERAGRAAADAPAWSARAVLERVFAQIGARAPLIAQPIFDRAVAEGTITLDERDELLRELAQPLASGEQAQAKTRASAGARIVLTEAFAAIRLAAPAIAEPILRQAVADERLAPRQSRRILERLRSSPAAAFRTSHPST